MISNENNSRLSIKEKKNICREYISGEYGSYSNYAKSHNMNPKYVSKIVRQYKSEIEAEAKSNTSYNFDDSPIESVSSSSSYMIQIPFAEYQDLRHKALQYDMVISALRQCT